MFQSISGGKTLSDFWSVPELWKQERHENVALPMDLGHEVYVEETSRRVCRWKPPVKYRAPQNSTDDLTFWSQRFNRGAEGVNEDIPHLGFVITLPNDLEEIRVSCGTRILHHKSLEYPFMTIMINKHGFENHGEYVILFQPKGDPTIGRNSHKTIEAASQQKHQIEVNKVATVEVDPTFDVEHVRLQVRAAGRGCLGSTLELWITALPHAAPRDALGPEWFRPLKNTVPRIHVQPC